MDLSARQILVPVHDSDSSRAALAYARRISPALNAELKVISVKPVRALDMELLAWNEPESATMNVALGAPDAMVWIAGDPLSVIVAEASAPEVGMVVMGYGERARMSRGFRAPLHEWVVRQSPVPVLVVRATVGAAKWFREPPSVGDEPRPFTPITGDAVQQTPPRGHLHLVPAE